MSLYWEEGLKVSSLQSCLSFPESCKTSNQMEKRLSFLPSLKNDCQRQSNQTTELFWYTEKAESSVSVCLWCSRIGIILTSWQTLKGSPWQPPKDTSVSLSQHWLPLLSINDCSFVQTTSCSLQSSSSLSKTSRAVDIGNHCNCEKRLLPLLEVLNKSKDTTEQEDSSCPSRKSVSVVLKLQEKRV
jgi:hypothetical protein